MAIADRIVYSRKKKTPEQTTAQNLPQIWGKILKIVQAIVMMSALKVIINH
jgi:hypothetical protein